TGCRIVVDHFSRPDPARNLEDPGWRAVLRAARDNDNIYMKITGTYRLGVPGYSRRDGANREGELRHQASPLGLWLPPHRVRRPGHPPLRGQRGLRGAAADCSRMVPRRGGSEERALLQRRRGVLVPVAEV
ncbi:unnamed protein product, partial [Ectocarpus sp. 12 AP-2014]